MVNHNESSGLLALSPPEQFSFPFEPYEIQRRFMRVLFEVIEHQKVGIFESPTGTGKSLSLICAALTWLELDRRRATEGTLEQLFAKLKAESPQEPDWILEQHVERKRRELIAEEDALEERLQAIRNQEAELKRKQKSSRQHPHQFKKRKIENAHDDSDEDFAPESTNEATDEVGPNGLPRSVQEMLDKYTGPKPQHREVELEPDCVKIYFTSRTHSQLNQFISEIRKTTFQDKVRVITLGSRANLCINRSVRDKAQTLEAINEACMDLQKSDKRCPHLPSLDEQDRMNDFRDHALAQIHDIEELAELGRVQNCCPYYGSRKAVRRAQIVTLPYNLLLQNSSREALGISLEKNVVIVDEAHNLIDSILGIRAVSLSNTLISQIHKAFDTYVNKFSPKLKGTNLAHLKHLLRVFKCLLNFSKNWSKNVPPNKVRHEEIVTTNTLLENSGVLDQLNVLELEKYLHESKIINKVAGYATKGADVEKKNQSAQQADSNFSRSRSTLVTAFYKMQAFILAMSNADKDGRILMVSERSTASDQPTITIKYQLLDASSSFSDIVSEARSVVLAGGTMAPLDDFHSQLFPFVSPEKILDFSCSHIVPPEHLLVRAVSKGPMGTNLQLKFSSKDDPKMQNDLGQSVANICNIIKDGVICFFPSYASLDTLTDRWKKTGLWTRLENKKKIFIEPKSAADVDKILNGYSAAVNQSTNPTSVSGGGLMLAVVGGKLSEGINFSNNLCRAVIVIGIPYPNSQSVELKERIKYVENLKGAQKDAGKNFYANLAFKAVNQSIERSDIPRIGQQSYYWIPGTEHLRM
ncbi:ATP-dependent DNA helicase chl1 [Puccinia graminis f. sp. tritici]|uniref:ATP-dependent DNA helicase CHL1 n=1 Tax=Puccinia graminis f. sp. tritici TaxID=56615 RepID=A0A5B0QSI4_PUCGR|nr:ATP-dependent DNA helicase chl1 [Puccinia graminis f. sp. tritici]